MKIIFAKKLGFCFGVKRAILLTKKALKKDPKPLQILGNLVHNEKVVDEFLKKGLEFKKNLRQVKSGTLIIQAHGFLPFSKKGILIRDATCPLVKKTQLLANFLFKNGYQVIIIGDKEHSETKGIKGYTQNKAIIIENKNEAKKLKEFKKIGVVVQTTQTLEKFNQILEILKNKTKEIKWHNTLCPEVINRQKDLNEILKVCDGILVIGSRLSANTKRLAEKSKKAKKKVFWINSSEELRELSFKGISVLGVVSGTSASDQEIKKIKKHLKS